MPRRRRVLASVLAARTLASVLASGGPPGRRQELASMLAGPTARLRLAAGQSRLLLPAERSHPCSRVAASVRPPGAGHPCPAVNAGVPAGDAPSLACYAV
jgi:hypothetical protein